jgi:hypothetical protein
MDNKDQENDPERLLRLVRKAIALYQTTPCFEWEERVMRMARGRCAGLEPREIRRLAAKHILRDGGELTVRKEQDEEWIGRRQFDYWFSICFEVEDVGKIYLKIALVCDDEDYPEARIIGAHESIA